MVIFVHLHLLSCGQSFRLAIKNLLSQYLQLIRKLWKSFPVRFFDSHHKACKMYINQLRKDKKVGL